MPELEAKVNDALAAAGITPTTEFIWTPVTSVVQVILDGMTEPLLLKRLERIKAMAANSSVSMPP